MRFPRIVSQSEWLAARRTPRIAGDVRRRPVIRIEKDYLLEGTDGEARLVDLFHGRRQLVLCHVPLASGVPDLGGLDRLLARDTSLALVSRAPIESIAEFRERLGCTIPWYSSAGGDLEADLGIATRAGDAFVLSVFVRDGADVLWTDVARHRGLGAAVCAFAAAP